MFILFGLLIGFAAAIPLGPVNVFVVSQALKRDFFHGFVAGAAACILDVVYCLISILGLSQVTALMNRWIVVLKIVASIFLAAIAIRMFVQSKQYGEARIDKPESGFSPRPLIAVVLMYISNPSLYAFWLAVGSMVSSHEWVPGSGAKPLLFSLAVGMGGLMWYFILTHYIATHHHQFSRRTFQKIFLILGFILLGFGAYTFVSIFVNLKVHL